MTAIVGILGRPDVPGPVVGRRLNDMIGGQSERNGDRLTFIIEDGFGLALRSSAKGPATAFCKAPDGRRGYAIICAGLRIQQDHDPAGWLDAIIAADGSAPSGGIVVAWDLDQRRLVLNSCRHGQHRLFVRSRPDWLAFATTLRPLVARRDPLDPLGVADFLTFGQRLGSRTVVAGVEALEPGDVRVFNDARARRSSAVASDVEPASRRPAAGAEDAAIALLEALPPVVADASQAGPTLLALGGIKSGLLAWAVREAGIPLLGVVIDRAGLEDLPQAGTVSAALGFPLRVVSDEGTMAALPTHLASLDEPLGDTMPLALLALSGQADTGVLLLGDGADDLIHGLPARESVNFDLAGLVPNGGHIGWRRLAASAEDGSLAQKVHTAGARQRRLVTAEIVGNALGLRPRLPFLDPRIKGTAMVVPEGAGAAGHGISREVLRLAARRVLPEGLAWRSKAVAAPAPEALLRMAPDLMDHERLIPELADAVNVDALAALPRRFLAGETLLAVPLWHLVVLAAWRRTLTSNDGC